jgi:hypothetical protein
VHAVAHDAEKQALTCGDGAFIRDESNITLVADTPARFTDRFTGIAFSGSRGK